VLVVSGIGADAEDPWAACLTANGKGSGVVKRPLQNCGGQACWNVLPSFFVGE
jgi:hypothetical protein